MKISINNIFLFFIQMGILMLPINSNNNLIFYSTFGELSVEGAFYPFLISGFFFLFYVFEGNRKIYFPQKCTSFYFMLAFLFWIFISGAVNLPNILATQIKGRSGVEKFILQILVLFFTVYVSVFIFNIFLALQSKYDMLIKLRKYVLISLLFVGVHSFLVIIEMLFISKAFFRLQSVSGEPSYLGMYLGFSLPWLLSYVITEKNKIMYIMLSFYIFLLVILTLSRTAFFIITVELILFSILFYKNIFMRNKAILLYSLFFLTIGCILFNGVILENWNNRNINILDVFTSLFMRNTSYYEYSNIGRTTAQMTAFNVFLDYPFFGVGMGQHGFYVSDYTPDWGFVSSEIRDWADSSPDTSWPSARGLYVRFLGELGLPGLFFWITCWFSILYKLITFIIYSKKDIPLLKALIISIVGTMLTGFNIDTLRFFGYWILLGVSWWYITFYETLYRKRD